MLGTLLIALPVILGCLLLQALFVSLSLRLYVRQRARMKAATLLADVPVLATVMLLTLAGNCVQMVVWALLFRLLGEFPDYPTALYHSAVNFSTLGYGDIVMSPHWRLLGPIEAAVGILMFGVSTSVMTAAVFDVIKYHSARSKQA